MTLQEPAPPTTGGAGRRPLPLAVLAGARPKQWVKNLLVFAAPGAAAVLDNPFGGARVEEWLADAAEEYGRHLCKCVKSLKNGGKRGRAHPSHWCIPGITKAGAAGDVAVVGWFYV